jgi:hypothetical protein
MTTNRAELQELRDRIAKLTREDQLLLAEEIVRGIRKLCFTDDASDRSALDEMIGDQSFQRVLNNRDLHYSEAELHEAG